ncbi:S9 family peptidase [Candidatus Sarmatiella mevalonica]|uniref:S9 family peptidase n=1 Tax=Candidatus Sarmatiella mevalonica TaxID=2770581 RepID=UPI0019210CC3|nr:S9 family peptidase [Candidatus Sarmatiella mevalonica]
MNNVQVPIAKKVTTSTTLHQVTLNDDYAWMRDAKWPVVDNAEILEYLHAENRYFDSVISAQRTQELFEELKGRIKLADQSVPIKKDNYIYYTKTFEHEQYSAFYRRALDANGNQGQEQLLLDVNVLAQGKSFTEVGSTSISPDHKFLAYSVDFQGDERYSIYILNLETNELLPDVLTQTSPDIVWHEELFGFFYTPTDENWRKNKIFFHKIGQKQDEDKLIFSETDPLFNLSIGKTSSKQHIIISSSGHGSNELYYFPMQDHSFSPKTMVKREEEIFYTLDHGQDYFYLLTNKSIVTHKKTDNFLLLRSRDGVQWQEYIRSNDDYLTDFDITRNYLILNYLSNGLPLIKVQDLSSQKEHILTFPDSAFTAHAGSTNFEEDDVRVSYTSLARPATVYNYSFANNELTVLKEQEIPSGFNAQEYHVERVFARSENVLVPISLMYKKDLFKRDGSNKLFLTGYGSYGIAMSPGFRSTAVSLANRGFVYAIAHIRGGDDMGHEWYTQAKFLNKKRTFDDFINCAQHLIDQKYTAAKKIVISGGSAGGLLIGNVINQRPELFAGAIAHVPFVDVVNTMLDESLPLTPGEFKEWGNPKEKEYFEYMLSYSPYENVRPQVYPALMVTSAVSDTRVGYWEAAKWVARLRANNTSNNPIIFKTNIEAGHRGASGRFDYLKEVAEDLVFILDVVD